MARKREQTRSDSNSLISRLTPELLLQLDADSAEMQAEVVQVVEDAQYWPRNVELLCHTIRTFYDSLARVCLTVARSHEEYEGALRGEFPRFIHFALLKQGFLQESLVEELEQGLSMFVLDMHAWSSVPPEERKAHWHVGASVAQTLATCRLEWNAKSLRHWADEALRDGASLRTVQLSSGVVSVAAARRVEAFRKQHAMTTTDLAGKAGTTDRTMRNFLKTGKIRRSIFVGIAQAMKISPEELLRESGE